MPSYPLPAYATSVWLGPYGLNVAFPPSPGHDSGSMIVLPATNAGFAALEQLLRERALQPEASLTLGRGGTPTQQQIDHERKHDIFPSEKCPFCRAEAQAAKQGTELVRSARRSSFSSSRQCGEVTVRRLAPKLTASSKLISNREAEELGL